MKPTIVLIGRPNVGKSTLFNRLTKSRDAIVADAPGLTRDRHYGHGRIGNKPFLVVDTGGFEPKSKEGIYFEMAKQTLQAVDEGDILIFIVDARQGVSPQDKIIGDQLRKTGKPIFLTVNKAEGMRSDSSKITEFHELGLGTPLAISSAHGEGVRELIELALEKSQAEKSQDETTKHPKIAIVGRPNVGKSTLVNKLIGEDRVIVFDLPGTTRDSIYIDLERNGKQYTIIDTAGVRKPGKREEAIEKFSVIKTLQSIEDANVTILVLDARQEISNQDAHIAGFILESGRALVIAVNKWDNLEPSQREIIKRDITRKLNFLSFAKCHYISALEGRGMDELFKSVDGAYAAAMAKLSTPKLTRALIAATTKQEPPRAGAMRPKLRYAHQGGTNPPLVIIHGNALDTIPDSYRRYLEGNFRQAFKLEGTPLQIQFKTASNPYSDKAKFK